MPALCEVYNKGECKRSGCGGARDSKIDDLNWKLFRKDGNVAASNNVHLLYECPSKGCRVFFQRNQEDIGHCLSIWD